MGITMECMTYILNMHSYSNAYINRPGLACLLIIFLSIQVQRLGDEEELAARHQREYTRQARKALYRRRPQSTRHGQLGPFNRGQVRQGGKLTSSGRCSYFVRIYAGDVQKVPHQKGSTRTVFCTMLRVQLRCACSPVVFACGVCFLG